LILMTKLTNGTNLGGIEVEKMLCGKEICSIISACAKSQVRKFELGELKISFEPEIIIPQVTYPSESGTTDQITEPQPRDDDAHFDFSYIDDPVRWERQELGEDDGDA